jgi:hypothetical protein
MAIHKKNEPKRQKARETYLKRLRVRPPFASPVTKNDSIRIKTETEQVTSNYFSL